ncbi:LLM class flavin-dependent oxidoreductase [Pseudonocardia sp. NPDC046786]|uniref:LLM class flavin-dependent oxidoreductase n=1 Tax=Pseudonocardia sp. NPDC046786 TaxID=3155471 RepID=UPI0033C67D5D
MLPGTSPAVPVPGAAGGGVPSFGFLLRLNGRHDPARQYRDGLEVFAAAERAGLDSGWITSHHFAAPQGTIASPLLYLTAAAARTTRLRLGAAVVVLTLEDPIRVAEDAALLDSLSGGRLELGLGRGLEDWPFAAFGIDYDDRRAIYTRSLERLRAVLGGTELPGGRRLHPPAPTVADRIWEPAVDIADGERIGASGAGLLASRSKRLAPAAAEAAQRDLVDAYREAARRAGHRPRVALSRTVYVGATEASARAEFDGGLPPGPVDASQAVVGGPAEVADRLRADPLLSGADHLLVQAIPAKLPLEHWRRSLELVGREVGPALARSARAVSR